MAFKDILLAALAALIMIQEGTSCVCTAVYYSLCQKYDMSDAVVHGTALSRNVTADTATYTIDIITLYKAEDNVTYSDEVSVNTPASTDDCGVTLTIGEEYLIGLDSDNDGTYTVVACHGLYETWSTDVEEEVATC